MQLRHIVLHPGKYRMEVLVVDPDGKSRLIEVQWFAKAQTDVPPSNWWEMVVGEVEVQRANERAAAQGRTLV